MFTLNRICSHRATNWYWLCVDDDDLQAGKYQRWFYVLFCLQLHQPTTTFTMHDIFINIRPHYYWIWIIITLITPPTPILRAYVWSSFFAILMILGEKNIFACHILWFKFFSFQALCIFKQKWKHRFVAAAVRIYGYVPWINKCFPTKKSIYHWCFVICCCYYNHYISFLSSFMHPKSGNVIKQCEMMFQSDFQSMQPLPCCEQK